MAFQEEEPSASQTLSQTPSDPSDPDGSLAAIEADSLLWYDLSREDITSLFAIGDVSGRVDHLAKTHLSTLTSSHSTPTNPQTQTFLNTLYQSLSYAYETLGLGEGGSSVYYSIMKILYHEAVDRNLPDGDVNSLFKKLILRHSIPRVAKNSQLSASRSTSPAFGGPLGSRTTSPVVQSRSVSPSNVVGLDGSGADAAEGSNVEGEAGGDGETEGVSALCSSASASEEVLPPPPINTVDLTAPIFTQANVKALTSHTARTFTRNLNLYRYIRAMDKREEVVVLKSLEVESCADLARMGRWTEEADIENVYSE